MLAVDSGDLILTWKIGESADKSTQGPCVSLRNSGVVVDDVEEEAEAMRTDTAIHMLHVPPCCEIEIRAFGSRSASFHTLYPDLDLPPLLPAHT